MLGLWGGGAHTERKRCLIYPPYFEPENNDFEVTVFELNYPVKFTQIEHRQILGALMNVGLKREKFGDILSDGERYQVAVSSEVADFISWNLTSVGKTKVSLMRVAEEDILSNKTEFTYTSITASSLRLDTVIAEAYKLSRSKAKEAVEAGMVKVNWKSVEDPSFLLQEKDMLSVRGKGRCLIAGNEGLTKKEKYRLLLGFPK